MSIQWDETRRAEAAAAGVDLGQIDAIEARKAQQLAAIFEEQNVARQSDVLAAAYESYYGGGDPASIADLVEREAGPLAARVFVDHWKTETETRTATDWERERREQAREVERVAEMLKVSQAENAAREQAERMQSIQRGFVERHPDAEDEQVEEMVVNSDAVVHAQKLAARGEQVDAAAALEAGYLEARTKLDAGRVAWFEAEQGKPFASTLRQWAKDDGLRKTPLSDTDRSDRMNLLDTEARAQHIYKEKLAAAMQPAQLSAAEETAAALESFARGRDGLVVTGASSDSERAAEKVLGRRQNVAGAIAQIEGRHQRSADFRAATETPASSIPDATPDPSASERGSTPRSAWWHND